MNCEHAAKEGQSALRFRDAYGKIYLFEATAVRRRKHVTDD